MIKFAIFPGVVISRNDGDRHYVGAGDLMYLYGVRREECVVVREGENRVPGVDLDRLLHLYPLSGPHYRPVSEREREIYPLDPSFSGDPLRKGHRWAS